MDCMKNVYEMLKKNKVTGKICDLDLDRGKKNIKNSTGKKSELPTSHKRRRKERGVKECEW